MKMRAIAVAISLVVSATGCSRESEGLSGEWIGDNYQCPFGTFHRETVRITERDGAIEAVKVTGDDCVPAGQVTFKGTRDKLTCIVGLPGNPASGKTAGAIALVDANTFDACSVRFVRK